MSRGSLGVLTSTTKEAPVSTDYDGRQYVGIDLHRRRSVIVRMTPEGQQLGWSRIGVICCGWGRLPEAYIASRGERELRELVRHRAKLVALRTGLKAQVHGVLAKQGLLPPCSDLFGVAGMAWLRAAPLDLVYRQRVVSLLELINAYDAEVEMFRTMIAHRFRGHRGYRVIQQISGIGPTFAAIFIAEIGDITRFGRPQKLTCWAGLTPRHRESDTTVRRGPITKQGSTLVRSPAIEACQRTRPGTKLATDRARIIAARGRNIGVVAAARKLLTYVYYGLRDGEIRALAKGAA